MPIHPKNSIQTKLPCLLFVLLCLMVFQTKAQNGFTFRGFYTIDFTVSDANLPIIAAIQARDYKKHKPSLANSVMGGQLKYQFSDAWSVTVQGSLAMDRFESIDYETDWAYLSYQFGQDWQARAGRFQVPFLQGTELNKVGFTRLWARKLTPGSGAGGFEHYNGIELIKQVPLDHGSWEFQLGLGQAHHGLTQQNHNKNMQIFVAKYQTDQSWIRAALLNGRTTVTTPRGTVIEPSGQVAMVSIEGEWTKNTWINHYGVSTSDVDIAPNDSMAYYSLGKQYDRFTPFAMVMYRKQHFDHFDPSGPPPGGPPRPPGNRPPGPPDGDDDFYSYSLGVNWQLNPKNNLKFQFEHMKLDDQARSNRQGRVINEGNVFSITLDGVF